MKITKSLVGTAINFAAFDAKTYSGIVVRVARTKTDRSLFTKVMYSVLGESLPFVAILFKEDFSRLSPAVISLTDKKEPSDVYISHICNQQEVE